MKTIRRTRVSTPEKIQIEVRWVTTPCGLCEALLSLLTCNRWQQQLSLTPGELPTTRVRGKAKKQWHGIL